MWQLALVIAAFLVMALPVWRLTRPAQAAAVASGLAGNGVDASASAKTAGLVTLDVSAEFAPAPKEFALSYLSEAVLQGKLQTSAQAQWKVPLPPEGADLVLHAVWTAPAGEDKKGNAAAKMKVRFPDGREVEKSFWATEGATLDTVLTVPGNAAPTP